MLANVFEQAGLTTVNLALVRGQAESSKPPRALYVDATGRTLLGRVTTPDVGGVVELIEKMIEIEEGATLDDAGLAGGAAIAAGQDIRADDEEAGLQLADVTGARALESWFYRTTEAGHLVLRVRDALKDNGTGDDLTIQYLAPATQAR